MFIKNEIQHTSILKVIFWLNFKTWLRMMVRHTKYLHLFGKKLNNYIFLKAPSKHFRKLKQKKKKQIFLKNQYLQKKFYLKVIGTKNLKNIGIPQN